MKPTALLALLLLVLACQPPPSAVTPLPEGTLVAEFSLPDVNPDSARFNQQVSPRDYAGRVSGWYFGHSS